ncbi:MAG: tocopherol cyclase family protein [Halarsenatibacteraceae bacterium]
MFYLKKILKPEVFHGQNKEKDFFEGWYFKLVDQAEENIFAFIPAIFLSGDSGDDGDKSKSHSFIQVLDGIRMEPYYHRYDVEQFEAGGDDFELDLAGSYFSRDRIKLDINNELQQIKGELKFTGHKPWPVKLTAPGAMGWYAYIPLMECYHGVLSFDYEIEGSLVIDGREVDFTGGRGYLEKDWGKSFPEAWLWMQTNHFETVGTSLMASIAIIPWLKKHFRGFIVGFYHQGRLYRFTSYNGSKIEDFTIDDNDNIWLELVNKDCQLTIQTRADAGTGLLYGPYKNEMIGNVKESLTAEIAVELVEKRSGKVIFAETGRNSGMELTNQEKIVD